MSAFGVSGHCADVPQCALLTQNGHRLIDPSLPAALVRLRNRAPCFIVSDSAGQKPAYVYFEETGTDTLVTRALVSRRVEIADIITINLVLPHLHEGARS